ncbi:MAG: type II secretion system protein [Phycisphaerae bacterium]|nr:type II secretion system protein [Phycisphaerae bacterium]
MSRRLTRPSRQGAFTIIELLTVMSIIVILIGLLVPALNRVRRYALDVKQKAQLHAIEAGLEMFRNECEDYPDSKAVDASGQSYYCGAMKLCEAVMGQDLMGYHPASRFLANSTIQPNGVYRLVVPNDANLKERKGPYLEPEKVSAHMLTDVFNQASLNASRFGSGDYATTRMFVLCDVYKKAPNLGGGDETRLGMPILYYRADPAGTIQDSNDPRYTAMPTDTVNNGFIYNYRDNLDILTLGMPWDNSVPPQVHRLANPATFYSLTKNPQYNFTGAGTSVAPSRPYRPDTYLLISAGWDGEYGTGDDITNYKQ